jgi:hypothetical protein
VSIHPSLKAIKVEPLTPQLFATTTKIRQKEHFNMLFQSNPYDCSASLCGDYDCRIVPLHSTHVQTHDQQDAFRPLPPEGLRAGSNLL